MIYEGQITYTSSEGKLVKENFVIEDAANFTHAELQLTQRFATLSDFDVVALKRSKVIEIANKRTEEKEGVWAAELQHSFVDDNGDTKYTTYKVLFYSTTFEMAKQFIYEYAKQGYDLELVSLKKTKFLDIL